MPLPETERAAPAWLTAWEYAHRGLHDASPQGRRIENSRTAFAAAIDAGFGIECDVQLSKDRVAMVFHDWVLDRLTGGSGFVADCTAAELCGLKLIETGDRIETLSQLLDQIDSRVPLLVEIKSLPDFTVEEACEAVSAALAGYDGPHAVMSFDARAPAWFANNDPARIRGLVCTDTLDHGWLGAWRAEGVLELARPDFLAFDIHDLPNPLSVKWREAGRPLLSWTIRSPELRERAQSHADSFISEGEGLA